MSYSYGAERAKLFTEEGSVMFMKVRDNVRRLLDAAGAFRQDKAFAGVSGDGWLMAACLDRLVELGEIKRVDDGNRWMQFQVYDNGQVHNR